MTTIPFRKLVVGVTIIGFLASNLTLRPTGASAQQPDTGAPNSFSLPSSEQGTSSLPPSQSLPPNQQQPQTQMLQPRQSAPSVTPNFCSAGRTTSVVAVPRSRPSGTVQTVRAGTAQPGVEELRAPSPSGAPEFEELSSIEAAFQSTLDSFLRFASPAAVFPGQALTPETPQTLRLDPQRQKAVSAQPTGARQLQERLQALEAKVQELTETTPLGPVPGQPGMRPTTAAAEPPLTFDPFAMPVRQYGYSMFAANVSTFAPVDDVPVGPDYVVGPGDDLFINLWGQIDSLLVRTVDRSGRIVLPKVGDLRVWGLTFSQADRLIREQLSRYFRGFQTSVTLGRLRVIRVHVVGEVCQPGTYTVSSLSTLTNALFSAGGPTKLGSLRNVRLLRNNHTVGTLDVYDFLQRGDRTRDFRLESGDTIFVPTIGEVAAVAGDIKRPAIYELRGDVRVADLIAMAGGLTPSSHLKRVQIVRSLPSAERVAIDVDVSEYYLKHSAAGNPQVQGGDLVLIHRSDPRIYNTVKVDGAVKYPGIYELKPLMRLSQLLPPGRLLPEAFLEAVEIARRRPDYSIEVIQTNLKNAWSGGAEQDLVLKPLDEITVRTTLREAGTVTLTGQVARPGKYVVAPGERLSSVLERAGGFTERAHLNGAVFTRASLRRIEQEQLDSFVRVQEQRILSAASTVVVGADKEDAAVSGQTIQARLDLLRTLAKRVALGRMIARLAPPERLKNSGDDVVLMDGDTLDVPEPSSSVLVIGAVRNSTSVSYIAGSNVDYYINRVGGLSNEADNKAVHLVKADGSTLSGFANIRTVEPGDTVVVPPREDVKVRVVPTIRDAFAILGSTLQTVLSAAALTILFH